jgi:hypothetical protein
MNENSFQIAKTVPAKQQVFGWASVAALASGETVIDSHDHVIPPDELESAVYEFNMLHRDLDENHTDTVQGTLIESLMVTPDKLEKMGLAPDALPTGWWVGFWIADPAVFQKVVNGEYSMFSIAGMAVVETEE